MTDAPTMPAVEAFELLGIGKTLGYKLIRTGQFPVPVIRMGGTIRVPRVPLERLLNGETAT